MKTEQDTHTLPYVLEQSHSLLAEPSHCTFISEPEPIVIYSCCSSTDLTFSCIISEV